LNYIIAKADFPSHATQPTYAMHATYARKYATKEMNAKKFVTNAKQE